MSAKRLQVKTLGGWSVTYDGKRAVRGKNLKIVLHALILSGGEVFREDLSALIGENVTSTSSGRYGGVRNALTRLRKYSLKIPEDEDPVILSTTQPDASIDLWEFFAHVRCERYLEAYALIADGQEPHLFAGAKDPDHHVWKKTMADFFAARDKTLAAIDATSGRRRSMLATREWLLGRSLVPGVGPSVPIRSVREKLERLQIPWTQEHPEETHSKSLLPKYLAELLSREGPIPTQAIVVGASGAGKTLTAISTFLRLTDQLEKDVTSPDVRTVLYIDPEAEGSQPGFGTDEWLQRRLQQEDAEDRGRPILIVPHGDSLLSPHPDLKTLLDARLFRDHDLLLCCGAQTYFRRLRYEAFGTHVVRLDPWSLGLQKSFARRVASGRKCREFEAWLRQDPTRRELCNVPLHLVHVLSLLGDDAEALEEISTLPQLFDGVARMRLRVARTGFDEDEMIRDLAALALRFYADAAPADTPIGFSTEELVRHLRDRKRRSVKRRADAMIDHSLLTVSRPGSNRLRFEEPSWGWYFVARHIVQTVLHRPSETLTVFSKLLSARVARLCEEILMEKMALYEMEIHSSLGSALRQGEARGVDPERLTIAREQVGYLLGVVGDRRIHDELAAMVEPLSSELEPNRLVRRGITMGLADGGDRRFADMYVETLTAEREQPGPSPERDTNIGFLLSSRGDQRFDPERPDRVAREVDPIRTFGDLVGSLEDARHSGSWRIRLFTLLDLGRHPRISRQRFRHALEQHHKQLKSVLELLQRDPEAPNWPELAELGLLIAEIDDAADRPRSAGRG